MSSVLCERTCCNERRGSSPLGSQAPTIALPDDARRLVHPFMWGVSVNTRLPWFKPSLAALYDLHSESFKLSRPPLLRHSHLCYVEEHADSLALRCVLPGYRQDGRAATERRNS